jgi:PAS domain S-box-containing protein
LGIRNASRDAYRSAAAVLGGAAAVTGGGYLVAWLDGRMEARGVTSISVQANTSLCILLLGLGLMTLILLRHAPARRWATQSLVVLPFLLGLGAVIENISGGVLWFDKLLAGELAASIGSTAPSRMGLPGGLCIVLIAASLWSMARRADGSGNPNETSARAGQSLALASCLISVLSCIGFLYGVAELHTITRLTAIAWPTALSLLALGFGLLLARPDEGWMAQVTADDPGGSLIRHVIAPAAILAILLGWLRLEGGRYQVFDIGIGTSLLVLISIVAFSVIVFSVGRRASETAAALQAAHGRLLAVFENAGVGIFDVEGDDHLIDVNERACEILGRPREELIGKTVAELTWPDDLDRSLAVNADLHAGRGERIAYEKRYVRGDGRPIWAHVTVSAVRDRRGRWLRSVTTIEDISERKRLEEDLRSARDSAERAKTDAEQANYAKDRFLAVLSHELRTPLMPVVTAVSLLERGENTDPFRREALDMIRRNVDMEARLIDDLLDVTRIAKGKIDLDRKPVPLLSIISRAIEVCRPDMETRRIEFGVDLCDGTVLVNADPTRLQQVFWNLLRNAIKFTPPGGCVGIRCRGGDHSVQVEFSDSGEGIEPGALPHIFDAFEQAEQSVTRKFGGLGLGLTISRALVELHGGTIEAQSDGKGKGATFLVRLPIAAVERPKTETRPMIPEVPTPSLRILMVEDHADTATMLYLALVRRGHDVDRAADVHGALTLANEREHDLLLSDLGLPDASGLELLRRLRIDGHRFPAIALSGYGQPEDLRRSKEAGFAAHLTKPVAPDKLEGAIREAMAASIRSGSG